MGRRGCRLVLPLIAAITVCSGCRQPESRVRIGLAIEPGWYAAFALAREGMADLPIDWIADSSRNVNAAASALQYAESLADQRVVAVVGHSSSRGSVAASAVYNRRGVLQLAPVATSRALTGGNPWSYALVPDDSVEGAFLAAYVDTALKARRVALLYHNDEFGVGIRDGVVAELERRRVRVADERFLSPVTEGFRDMEITALLAAALNRRPDAIILGARMMETRAVAAYLRRRRTTIPVVCSDGSYVFAPRVPDRDLTMLEGIRIVRFWGHDRDSVAAAFADRFKARYGYAPDQAEAFTYDALGLIGDAVRAGARTPEELRSHLESLGRTRPAYRGIAGEYQFSGRRAFATRMDMGLIRDGRLGAVNPAGAGR